ncbi:MAG: histidinol-phosphate transaminase [Candidatus Hermodarchaeota archaeon]
MKKIQPANNVQKIKTYVGIKPLDLLAQELNIPQKEIIKLDGNENPYGALPEAKEALRTLSDIQIYPDPLCSRLVRAIAKKEGMPEDCIIAGAGVDELIDLLIRGFTNVKDTVLSLSPTFGMYSYLSQVNGANYTSIPQKLQISDPYARYYLDERAFLQAAAQAKLVFLTRPNNPDGQILPVNFVKKLLELPILVIIDEAYIEFANQPSLAKYVLSYENLVILRTFSKAFALGGLRVGYGVVPPNVREILTNIKQPYNVNVAAQEAALRVLFSPSVKKRVFMIKETREWFIQELIKLQQEFKNFWIHRSQACYILLTFQTKKLVNGIYDQLRSKGILVRRYSSFDMAFNLRISIGRLEQIEKVVEEIRNILTGMRE